MSSSNCARHGRYCVWLLPLILSGCFGSGGGGGAAAGETAVGASGETAGSAAAFATTATAPAAGAAEVQPDAVVSASFNRELDAGSIDVEGFVLSGPSGPVPARQVYAEGDTAYLLPEQPLALASLYTARLEGARSRSGEPLGAARSWSFITRDGEWQSGQLVAPLPGEDRVVVQDLAFDAAGNGIMVFGTDAGIDPAGGRLWAVNYTAGGGWGTPQVIGDDAFLFYDSVDLQLTADGRGVVLAQYYDDTPAYVVAHSYDPVSGWSPVQELGVGTENGAQPRLAIDAEGNALAVWAHFDEFERNPQVPEGLLASRLRRGEGWSEPRPLGVSPVRRPGAALAMNTAGEALLAWEDDIVGNEQQDARRVYVRHYAPASGWGEVVALGELTSFYGAELEAALGDTGAGQVVWSDSPRVLARRYRAGEGWQPAVEIATGALGRYAALDQLQTRAGGELMLLYRLSAGDSGAAGLHGAAYAPEAGWSTPELLQQGEFGHFGADLTTDAAGNALAVWRQRPAGSAEQTPFHVYASRYRDRWQSPEQLDDAYAGTERAQVGVHEASGTGWALWAQPAGTGSEVWGRPFR